MVLHWLDDRSCLAVFDDPATARIVRDLVVAENPLFLICIVLQALNTLRGPFVVSLYKEEVPRWADPAKPEAAKAAEAISDVPKAEPAKAEPAKSEHNSNNE